MKLPLCHPPSPLNTHLPFRVIFHSSLWLIDIFLPPPLLFLRYTPLPLLPTSWLWLSGLWRPLPLPRLSCWALSSSSFAFAAFRLISHYWPQSAQGCHPVILAALQSHSHLRTFSHLTLLSKVTYKGGNNQATSNRDLV